MDTSSTCGTAATNGPRLSRLRSCPALMPRPASAAARAASANAASEAEASPSANATGVGLGVELDAVGAHVGGGGHRCGVGVHEEADAAAVALQPLDERAEAVGVAAQIPAVVRGPLAGRVRDERALRHAAGLARAGDELDKPRIAALCPGERVALDVELGVGVREEFGERDDVGRADVAAVRARVHRQPVGPGVEADPGGALHARHVEVAGVAEEGHLVQVDAQRGFGGVHRAGSCECIVRRAAGSARRGKIRAVNPGPEATCGVGACLHG